MTATEKSQQQERSKVTKEKNESVQLAKWWKTLSFSLRVRSNATASAGAQGSSVQAHGTTAVAQDARDGHLGPRQGGCL